LFNFSVIERDLPALQSKLQDRETHRSYIARLHS